MAQFPHMINEALDEVEEMRVATEYDEEFMGDALNYLDSLEDDLMRMASDIDTGEYPFGGEELPFMAVVKRSDSRVPVDADLAHRGPRQWPARS